MLENIKEIVDLYLGNKSVGKDNIRKYTNTNEIIRYEGIKMSKQAKTLNSNELRRVLDYVATRKHGQRNRAIVLTMYFTGMRVGEAASLRYTDVVDIDGSVRNEIFLRAEDCKGNVARTVFVNEKLKKELQTYVKYFGQVKNNDMKLFYSQKKSSDGFSANSLAQYFHYMYKRVGLVGASSHSTRRTFATNISEKGVSIRVIQKLLGHASIQTTARYCEANDSMLRRAVELVA